jgi:hypothetical protein
LRRLLDDEARRNAANIAKLRLVSCLRLGDVEPTRDEAKRIAANIAKAPELLRGSPPLSEA